MKKTDLMLWRMVKHSSTQFIAVVVIITVGIAVFISLSMVGINLNDSKSQYYKENVFEDFSISVQEIPSSVIDDFYDIEGIALAEGRLSAEVPFIGEQDERVNVRLLSFPAGGQKTNKLLMREGRTIKNPNEEVIVLSQFADGRNIGIDDKVVFQVNGTRCELKVVGIAFSPEFIYLMESAQAMMPASESYGVLYIDEMLLMQLTDMNGAYNEVFFTYEKDAKENVSEKINVDDLISDVEKIAKPYGLIYTTERKNQLSEALVTAKLENMISAGIGLPLMFLFVAALVISMMVSRMVKKDRIKIGVMKAMGYSNANVLSHYVKYSLAAGIVGGVLGTLVGYQLAGSLTSLFSDFFEIPLYGANTSWGYVFGGTLLSSLFCVVSGIYGAREVLKIVPAESMQAEPPKEGKRIFLESFPFLWKRLSFSRKLTAKNIFRNKKRSGFVLFGVSLTLGLIMFTMTMPQVMDEMMVKHFEEVQTMDYNISFSNPVPSSTARDIAYEISKDSYVEGRIEYPFELSVGNKVKSVLVIGFMQESEVLHLVNLSGKTIKPEKGQILLTQNLSNILGVSIGDRIFVESYRPGGKDAYFVVQDIVKQMMGMNAYMDMGDMGDKLLEHNVITGVYINSQDKEIVSTLRKMDNISTILSSDDMKAVFLDYTGMISMMLSIMVILSGVMGFAVVYNATIVSLSERKMEFSSLRVLGFGKEEIFNMILAENIILSIAAIFVGIPIGYAMTLYSSTVFATELYTLYMNPTLSSTLIAILLTAIFVLISQFATYEKIRKLDFLQALKNRAS